MPKLRGTALDRGELGGKYEQTTEACRPMNDIEKLESEIEHLKRMNADKDAEILALYRRLFREDNPF